MNSALKPIVRVENLEVKFSADANKKKAISAVNGVSFDIYPGEKVGIVGESGSGKSTTAHAIIGLLPGTGKVSGGSIEIDGQEFSIASEKDYTAIRGAKIGLVPQDPMSNLNPVYKIGFQVEEALKANGAKDESGKALNSKAIKERAAKLLENAGLQDAFDRMKQYPHEFSGGMRQRVLIAIGLASRPELLIADEPTSALDVTVQKVILDHLDSLTKDLGTAVLFITHDLGLAAERAEKLIVMHHGKIVESGPSAQIINNPQHPYTKKLIAAAPSIASTRLVSKKTPDELSAEKDGELQDLDVVGGRKKLITVRNLTKEFNLRGKKEVLKAVDDVTFSVRQGRTTAIVGESGSGKSTVANMILGLLEPTSGEIQFDCNDLAKVMSNKRSAKDYRKRVQPVFQNPYGSLDPVFSIGRAIEEPLKVHQIGDKNSRHARVRDLLDMVKLPNSLMHRYPSELSGGQRQRVAIARALAVNPELMVLDEAVSALDVLVQEQILTLLNDLQTEIGLTYLFITHDLAVVRLVADNVVVMEHGKIVEKGAVEDVFFNPCQEYTKHLLDAIPGRHLF
ncbi:MAG: ABC transporter ATP-binding protein [Candidatus Ancillula sp.]|jgi:peptide/nickel transport system ATP-binding protein|nr:ABC transporter ATP-binding protein [Candidatus Ancillula sp.]